MTEPGQQTRRTGGLPEGVTMGASWPKMVAEVRRLRVAGRIDSLGRRLVEGLVGGDDFTEIGGLIGVPEDGGTAYGQESGARIPGEVVGGWGRFDGRLVFAVADESTADVPRNPAGATIANTILVEAFRRGAPYVAFTAARRERPDLESASAFMRVGLQLDLDLERTTASAIPKITAICGTVDHVGLLEASFSHLIIAGPGCSAELPDGTRLDEQELAELGWVDLVCDTESSVLDVVRRALALFPDSAWQSVTRAAGSAGDARSIEENADRREVMRHLLDERTAVELSADAPGSLSAAAGRIDGHAVGVAAGTIGCVADSIRFAKLRRICSTFSLPMIVVDSGADALKVPVRSHSGGGNVPTIVVHAAATEKRSVPIGESPVAALSWHSGFSDIDAVISPASTREVVARLLDDLSVGTLLQPRGPRVNLRSDGAEGRLGGGS